jgi:integrase
MGVKVRQKGDKWYVFINHQGQRKAKCIGSDKRVAVQVQKQLEAKLALGDVGLLKEEPEGVLFRDYAEQWLHTYVATRCKPSSARNLRQIVRNHLVPAFGKHAMTHLTRQHVKDLLATKHHLSPKYVGNILKVCSMLLNHAVDDAVIQTNPAARLGKYLPAKEHNADDRIMPFTSTELARYLQAMAEHYPQYYPYFLTLARTGIREGEGLGLRWDDIQFGRSPADPHRFIHVQRTYDPVHNRMNTPKSSKTRRVDMAKDLRTCLMDWREQCFEQAVLAGQTTPFPVVFATVSGRPWAPARLYYIHKRCCALAGLRAARIHDLRHSYATILLYELHTPIQYVSEQLGHSSIKITIDIYGHPRQGMSTHLVDQLVQPTQLSATLAQPDHRGVA